LSFRVCYRDRRIGVTTDGDYATYELLMGEPLSLRHHGDDFELGTDPVTLAITRPPAEPPLSQPMGREPRRRKPELAD
jgi:alpha,alpha-trehalose phosphorylase